MATTSRSGSGSAPDDEDSTPAMRRLRRLSLHLLQPSDRPVPEEADSLVPAAFLRLRGRHRAMQARVYEFYVARPELQTPVELPTAAHRELCSRQMSALVREAGVRPLTLMASDPAEDKHEEPMVVWSSRCAATNCWSSRCAATNGWSSRCAATKGLLYSHGSGLQEMYATGALNMPRFAVCVML